ncbi:MAG: uridine kinase [Elusimicrobia bacterium]|nr:uridine kinase [Elusimicrobiota bacterium]
MTNHPRKRFLIGIAGSSGSGKTTFARRIIQECRRAGIKSALFSLDNYYRPLDGMSLPERRTYNFDHPDAIDFSLAREHLQRLMEGRAVRMPVYDFKLHTRSKQTISLSPSELIVVEGLYALHEAELLALYDYKLFVSTSLPTAILRRVERDISERGRTVENAKHQILSTVLPMYETYVRPTQKNAHFSINWEGEEIPDKATEGIVRMVRDHFR